MDKFDIRKLPNSSKITDSYWFKAAPLNEKLIEMLNEDDDSEIKILLKNPYLFKGRS